MKSRAHLKSREQLAVTGVHVPQEFVAGIGNDDSGCARVWLWFHLLNKCLLSYVITKQRDLEQELGAEGKGGDKT